MITIADQLLQKIQPTELHSGNKITVVGAGQVGMACAFSILTQRISNDVCLVDCIGDKLVGEMMDLQYGSMFLNNCKITASTEYSATADSRLCIVTAGVRQNLGESRLDLAHRNMDVIKFVVPELVRYSPNAILLIVTTPVDILTHIAWKLSGFPKERVIGSGTHLDSSRFRFLLSQKLGVPSTSCHGWIIGEHGDSSVAVWSSVNVAGVKIADIKPGIGHKDDVERFTDIHQQVISSASQVKKLKGYTSWAVGMAVADIAQSIIYNLGNVYAVSVLAKGCHGIEEEVFLSLPAILGSNGVTSIIIQPLTNAELVALKESAKILDDVRSMI